LSVLAVVLQIVGAVAFVAGAGLFFDSAWAAVIAGGIVVFAFGDALERR
jgi:hypothetical protein